MFSGGFGILYRYRRPGGSYTGPSLISRDYQFKRVDVRRWLWGMFVFRFVKQSSD